ncbi:MAG: glucans biosynthesis glucosyltransferase MdoH [Deltaproteobacteria bacterium]|nr:glucans biosynthesis glucosyltransferase MdoH [Deltaproteobacteria bacterium]
MDRRPWLTALLRSVGRRFGFGGSNHDPLAQLRTPRFGQNFNLQPWDSTARFRRLILGLLVIVPSCLAGPVFASVLPNKGGTVLELALVVVFALLFAWISIGFWTALLGFATLVRKVDRLLLTRNIDPSVDRIDPKSRTAVLFPVCNEDMTRVCAGILATYRSLESTGGGRLFDFFVLSDTGDPDAWIEEEVSWQRLCRELGNPGNIFYRRRRINQKRKSGNVADFCRRFGRHYVYLLVMDADSVMAGTTMVKMVAAMERKPRVGILQTAPAVAGRETLLARVQQFASRAYGPMFAAGLHSMQLADAHFWGHNAILRTRPFMKHCGLPRLPGKPPLGGDILSHDFVEAALMRRAGWEVWLAYDLEGSYEETPPTLLAELKRDKRWCTGNLQHLRLVFTRGLFPTHRVLFLNGAMSYISAFLWFLLLLLSTTEAIMNALFEPIYFPLTRSLFPIWPVWTPYRTLILLSATAIILFLPKLLSGLLIAIKGRGKEFGGYFRLGLSILGEVVLSTLLAPIRMMFHTKFVLTTLMGRPSGWGRQQRDDLGTSWWEAVRFHWGGTLFAALWGGTLYLLNSAFFWWITPIIIPLLLAIPLSVLTSRASVGRLARRLGFFLTPEEVETPWELRETAAWEKIFAKGKLLNGFTGFSRAIVDTETYNLHLGLLQRRRGKGSAALERERDKLISKVLQHGPGPLSTRAKKALLYDSLALTDLHRRVWQLPVERLKDHWGVISDEDALAPADA